MVGVVSWRWGGRRMLLPFTAGTLRLTHASERFRRMAIRADLGFDFWWMTVRSLRCLGFWRPLGGADPISKRLALLRREAGMPLPLGLAHACPRFVRSFESRGPGSAHARHSDVRQRAALFPESRDEGAFSLRRLFIREDRHHVEHRAQPGVGQLDEPSPAIEVRMLAPLDDVPLQALLGVPGCADIADGARTRVAQRVEVDHSASCYYASRTPHAVSPTPVGGT